MEDREAIVALKTAYIRHLYRGFVSESALQVLDPTPYDIDFLNGIDNPKRKIILSEENGTLIGYVAYGADPDEPGCALLDDVALTPGCSPEIREELLMYAVEDMATRGTPVVHTWVMRDNFRARFLFEKFGFRCEGKVRTFSRQGNEFQQIRYAYFTPEQGQQTGGM